MVKYVYRGKEYATAQSVRQAVFAQERKALPSEPVDGKDVFWSRYGIDRVMQDSPIETEVEKANREIHLLKAKLKSRDYIGVKIATGCATAEEYAKEIEECEQWRSRINELELVIKNAK